MNPRDNAQPGPTAGAVLRPPSDRNKSPAGSAFEAMISDPRLNSSAKVIAGIIEAHCRSDDNAACYLGRKTMARLAGWDRNPGRKARTVKDGGIARVGRALALLARCGHLHSLSPAEFWRWHAAIGGPKLGIRAPRPKGRPRRFHVARWKRPDAGPEDWTCPLAAPEARADERLAAPEARADERLAAPEALIVDPLQRAPMSASDGTSARATENVRTLEPGVGTGQQNVTAHPRGEQRPPEAAPALKAVPEATEAEVLGWLAAIRSPRPWLRDNALRSLDRVGRVPDEWRDRVPPPLPADVDPPAEPPRARAPAVQLSPSELLDDRVRRLARGEGPRDPEAIGDLAFDVSSSILDAHSVDYHGQVLAEVAAGTTRLEPYLIALRKARAARRGEGGREFARHVEPYRPGWKRKRQPAGSVLATHRRAAQGTVSH